MYLKIKILSAVFCDSLKKKKTIYELSLIKLLNLSWCVDLQYIVNFSLTVAFTLLSGNLTFFFIFNITCQKFDALSKTICIPWTAGEFALCLMSPAGKTLK